MADKNKSDISKKNKNVDIFDNFKKENSDIDDMLKDVFSFMDDPNDEVEYENSDTVYGEEYYNENAYEEFPIEDDAVYYEESNYSNETVENIMGDYENGKTKKKTVLYSVLIGFLSILIVAVIVFLALFNKYFGGMYSDGSALPTDPNYTLPIDENFETMYGVSNAADLNDALKKWATNNGEIMDSSNIINILLIGQDGGGSETTNGLADSMIIVSVNKVTKTITMASIMRDSYTYMNVDGKDRYRKINASCVFGGQNGVVQTIENNYKIDIDYWASVYFDSFKGVIDALGGVEVPIEPGFASYINRTTRYNVSSGDAVHLNGAEALVYSRIRYYFADGDAARAANQRRVINSIMQKARGANVNQLKGVLDAVTPYIKTNMKSNQILTYGTQALSEGWVNYNMKQETFPTLETRGSATINTESVWVVDYPLAAQQMQQLLYGKTNIKLSSDRVNVLTSYLTQKPQNDIPAYSGNNEGTVSDNTTNVTQEGWTGETESFTGETTERETEYWENFIPTRPKPTDPQVTDTPVTNSPETNPPVTNQPQETPQE